ncbi:MAG: HD domain-containing protein [Solirubrobacteraceae bacterium]|nr:HD domain-containing protein [Solirubrobacteraceae bacterium]
MELHLSDVLAGLSHALDLTEGHPPGHAERSCLLGMRIADRLSLPDEDRKALYYALLLKDAGCSVNAAPIAELYGNDDGLVKATRRQRDHRSKAASAIHTLRHAAPGAGVRTKLGRVRALVASGAAGAAHLTELRCERGAQIALDIGLGAGTAAAIRALDEHWDGGGYPYGLEGEQIPLLGRIMCLAQTLEIFWVSGGRDVACDMAAQRRGKWFDPALVDVILAARDDESMWAGLARPDVRALEPRSAAIAVDESRLDSVAAAFGQIVDAKTPYTARHSRGVAQLAALIALELGTPEAEASRLYRAGQLHDLGKLGISNTILDKPGKLTSDEWLLMRGHPEAGHAVLKRIPVLTDMARLALTHHERLDGSGYPHGLTASDLGRDDRILAVADVGEALSAERPYREALPQAKVLAIMSEDAGHKLDSEIFEAFEAVLPQWSALVAAEHQGELLSPIDLPKVDERTGPFDGAQQQKAA